MSQSEEERHDAGEETLDAILSPDAPDLFGRVVAHVEALGSTNFMDIANDISHVQALKFNRDIDAGSEEWQVNVAATFTAAQGVLAAFGHMLGLPASVIEEAIAPWMHDDSTATISFLEFGQRLAKAQRKWINSTVHQTNLLEEMVREALPSDEIPDTLPTEGTPPE